MLTGVIFFVKQLDGPLARWIGYIYCTALERPFFVNEQRMVKGSAQPALGAMVEFKEGVTQEGKEFATATSVRESAAVCDPIKLLVPLEVTATIYRLPLQIIRTRLENKFPVLHEEAGLTLLSIAQIKALIDRPTTGTNAKQTKVELPDPPDNQLRFGQLVREELDRGFGFVKEQGKGKPEIFAHVRRLNFEPRLNDWFVFAVGPDGRVSWARKPAQALPWLRRSYATFSIDALDALFRLGEQELAQEVLDFRIERILAAKAEVHLPNGAGLLEKVLKHLPKSLPYTYDRLLAGVESIGKLRLWAQFGGVEDAPLFVETLNEVYQSTVNQQAAEMPRVLMLGLLDLGRDQAKAEAVVQVWWPVRKIEGMAAAELAGASGALFKWLREWYRLLSLGSLLPPAHESYVQRWRILAKELRSHFAKVGGAVLGTAVYEATGLLLPVPELVRKRADLLPEDVLLDLIRDGGEAGYLALAAALQRLGKIETETKYEQLRQWLNEIRLLQTVNSEWGESVMAAVAEASSPVYRLNLWSTGYLPDLNWENVVGRLAEDSARSAALEVTNKADLRIAAARRLLHLYSKSSATSDEAAVDFMKALCRARTNVAGSVLNKTTLLGKITLDEKGRVIPDVIKASQKEATDFRQGVDELIQETIKERSELAFAMWEAGLSTELPGSAALARLVALAKTDEWATLPAWAVHARRGAHNLEKLLELLLGADGSHLLELPRSMLLPWIEQVVNDEETPETAQRQALLNDLLNSERRDIVLPLLAWGLHQASDPGTYLSGLNSFELEALLDAPTSQMRLAAAFMLLDVAHEAADQAAVIQILARLGLSKLKLSESATLPDGYYQSAALGRLFRQKSLWHLGTYQALLRAPATAGSEPPLDLWDLYQTGKAKRRTEKEALDEAQKKALVNRALAMGNTRLQHRLWEAGVVETPAYDQIYDEINFYADGFDRTGDETAWEPAYELVKLLNEFQRLAFLDWVLGRGHTTEIVGWNCRLLHSWLNNLPDTAEKQATWARLLTALTTPALLKLWLADLIEHYDFGAYRLLVFTLAPSDQLLFLRKTFRLLAADELQLTAAQLNTIVRYSRDELGGGAVLDYSVDLALVVLGSLARDGSLPSEGGIVEVVCRYIGEDTTSLSPVGKELFAACPGRSEVERIRAPHKDVVKGRVEGIEYLASADKKKVFVGGIELDVANNTVELSGGPQRVSWIVTPGYDYQPGSNSLKLKPEGIDLCEGRLAHKIDDESQLPFWWCCNRPCYKANQDKRVVADWQRFTLADFISILNLPFNLNLPSNDEAYYVFVGLINRVNRLLEHLQCRCCNHILRPVGQSDFNFYRANRFRCTNRNCEEQEQEVYLSHCLNGHCMSVIDSRDSNRCSYRTEGRPDRQGMYICAQCGGCCSKQALLRRKESLERTYRPEMLVSHNQYKLITESLTQRLYHWERMRVFCYQCTKPMQQRHPEANYNCPDCRVEYSRAMVHIEVARRKNLFETDV